MPDQVMECPKCGSTADLYAGSDKGAHYRCGACRCSFVFDPKMLRITVERDGGNAARTYRGTIRLVSNGEEDGILLLGGPDEDGFLAERIQGDIDAYGRYLSVRYFITDREIPEEDVVPELIRTLAGAGDARYHMVHSEITGHLYTHEDLKVGGHDLLAELKSHAGKFCHLDIQYGGERP